MKRTLVTMLVASVALATHSFGEASSDDCPSCRVTVKGFVNGELVGLSQISTKGTSLVRVTDLDAQSAREIPLGCYIPKTFIGFSKEGIMLSEPVIPLTRFIVDAPTPKEANAMCEKEFGEQWKVFFNGNTTGRSDDCPSCRNKKP